MKKVLQTSNDLGTFMREARKRSGKSVNHVALKSGYSSQTITNMELNRGSIVLTTLFAVAKVIGVEIELKFDEKNNIYTKETIH